MDKDIRKELTHRILLLDGGMGTMVQQYGLTEEDYRGARFADWEQRLKGCNDLLALTHADVIQEIHEKYLSAGADVITTDSFNANAISLKDYGLEAYSYEISRAAATIARRAADTFTTRNPNKPRFVGGSIGPSNRTASMSADISDPAAREVTFEQLAEAYREQARGLMDGGVDLLMLETFFDTLNAKAAIYAVKELLEERKIALPLIVSGTLTTSGRTLSGQTIEAFYTSITQADPLAVSLNCSFGAQALLPHLERLAAVAECRVAAYPNAGLPNVMGGYDETPARFAADVEAYLQRGLVNLVGGCCGTTPAHIFELTKIVSKYAPRPLPSPKHITTLSGLEPLRIVPESNFINIGERTNVAGSAKFARLIREGNFNEALTVARAQVDAGAQVVDICMDDGLIDGKEAMRHFLNLIAAEPEIARVPVMIDSSKWEVLEEGLRVWQGKSIVNSISLKEGEEAFRQKARKIHRYGAAAVVMLFDQKGQADTYERKIEVATRAYNILTADGFPAEDIIFDPNVLAVATGIEAHDSYARDFIEATRWIKQHLPQAKVSGGVSNLSFAFRGNNTVREAMHAVFLYHAIDAGMDMGIVNPQLLQVYDTIEPELLQRVEDVILCRRTDASERLSDYATTHRQTAEAHAQTSESWRALPLQARMAYAMRNGLDEYIAADALEGYQSLGSSLLVIDQLLMPAMEEVGQLFASGKMFLPQVVKTARVMKGAVNALTPYIEQGTQAQNAGRILIATVKGDVHDIGKNIVSVVMACNGYQIQDLGVMVETERIVNEVEKGAVDVLCLSGLITPSLDEMMHVCEELQRRGLRLPVLIGGATTSELHTAVKIAPLYEGVIIHASNANDNCRILAQLAGAGRETYIAEVKAAQQKLREEYLLSTGQRELIPIIEARKEHLTKAVEAICTPLHRGVVVFPDFDITDVIPFIDWNFFFPAWDLKGRMPAIFEDPKHGEEARKLYQDAQVLLARIGKEKLLTLQGAVGIFPAVSCKDDIWVTNSKGGQTCLPMLRNQTRGQQHDCLADFIVDKKSGQNDYIGCFALSAGVGLKQLTEQFKAAGDDYNAIMAKLLADRLTEAFAEMIHRFVRREMWGYAPQETCSAAEIIRGNYRGLRMAFGYPAAPDHALKKEVFELLSVSRTTQLRLTENNMIDPGESLCGLIFPDAHYFSVGAIDTKQLLNYAKRRGITPEQAKKCLPNNV
ncbi:MAG: methionine synthase [Alistipes sp.]